MGKTQIFYAPPLSPQTEIADELKKINKKLDKSFESTKLNSEVKNKAGNCRFCGRLIMRAEEISHFIKATIKCQNCDRIVKIPDDLTFNDIN